MKFFVSGAQTGRVVMAESQQWEVEPLEESIDHVRGPVRARLILEYGDYECPYSRAAYRSIQRLEAQVDGGLRFVFRHFPLIGIHPHALGAARAAEAATAQDRFWNMHGLLFHRQKALTDADLRSYASELGLDLARFDADRQSESVLERIHRDVRSGEASGEVLGTPTLFIDGRLYEGSYAVPELMEALKR